MFTLSSASPKDCSQEHKVLILYEERKGPFCLLFPNPSNLQLVSPGSCLPYPPTPLQPIVSKMPFKMLLAKALSPQDLHWGSQSFPHKLPVHCQCLDLVYNMPVLKSLGRRNCKKTASESPTQHSSHILFFSGQFGPTSGNAKWMDTGFAEKAVNKQHHKLPPQKIESLPSICRCCSGHSMPRSIGHIGIKWFVLLHQSATITLHLANPSPHVNCSVCSSKSRCTDHSYHLKIILEVVIPLIITSLKKNQAFHCPSR